VAGRTAPVYGLELVLSIRGTTWHRSGRNRQSGDPGSTAAAATHHRRTI
jgi:hypothetical protein